MTLFQTRINTSVLDRILVNQKSVEIIDGKIQKYIVGANNTFIKEVMDTETSLQMKGILVIEELYDKGLNSGMYYSIDKDTVTIAELEGDTMTFKAVLTYGSVEIELKSFVVYKKSYKLKNEQALHILKETAKRTVRMIFDFYRYTQLVTYLKTENKVVIKRASINSSKGKTKKELQREAREYARKRVKLSDDKKVYDYSESAREGDVRKYERHTDKWESRGYWKTMKKSGKRVWVKGSVKGDKMGERKAKDFTV